MKQKTVDLFGCVLILSIIIGLPLSIHTYDRYLWQNKISGTGSVHTLTGHTHRGWILGDVKAYEVASPGMANPTIEKPVIKVRKGEQVVLKLKSSDVVHGFSLKDFNIFINDGIQPGKVTVVTFTADKEGTFTFACNAICGDNHQIMQGTLIVSA